MEEREEIMQAIFNLIDQLTDHVDYDDVVDKQRIIDYLLHE